MTPYFIQRFLEKKNGGIFFFFDKIKKITNWVSIKNFFIRNRLRVNKKVYPSDIQTVVRFLFIKHDRLIFFFLKN